MLNVKYAGFGGYMEVPCYEDEKGKLYFDENNGIGGLNLYTGAYRDEFGDILGEPDKKVTEDVRCAEPFARHTRENDYRMLGRLKQDCEYFLGYGAGNEDALYYKNVAAHCDAMEKLWNSFSEADKPEWLSMEDINEYRHVMTKALEDKEKNNLTACVDGLTAALDASNKVLEASQNPKASLVAGFKSWEKNFERHVKRGEKGIKILAPSPYTKKVLQEKVNPDTGEMILDKNGNPVKEETEIKLTSFRVVSVFDVSQTEGKELPSMARDLHDNIKDYPLYIQALEQVSDVPIAFEEINGSAHGYYSHATDSIAIQSGMSESQTLKTMIHEIAHSILHNDNVADAKEKDRQTKEVEAESVAYTVCKHLGIDSSDYSFGYIAGWSAGKELNELKSSLETIRKTSSGLITGIEDKLEKLRINKEISVSEQPLENVTDSVTLQQSKEMMSAALGSTDELLSLYKDNNSRTVAQAVNVVAEERAEYNNKLTVKQAIENRQHTHYGAYADIGTALDKFSTDELIDYLRKNEPGGEGSLRGYVESQIIGAQINRERYQSENNFVTESVTDDMTYEPDIEQTTGMRI